DLVDAAGVRSLVGESSWLYGDGEDAPQPLDQLSASSFLCQLHAMVTRRVLKLEPSATIGYSSGESNALFAMGAWTDLDGMITDCRRSEIFTRDLAGECRALRRTWNRVGASAGWTSYSVSAPVDEVRAALASEPCVHLTIVNTPDDCVIGGEATA